MKVVKISKVSKVVNGKEYVNYYATLQGAALNEEKGRGYYFSDMVISDDAISKLKLKDYRDLYGKDITCYEEMSGLKSKFPRVSDIVING